MRFEKFKRGKRVFYSDFNDKSYAIVELINITKKRGTTYWFNAKIIDNSNITPDNRKKFFQIDSIHSFSNSFIYETYKDLKLGVEAYKEKQIDFLTKKYLKDVSR